MRSLGSAGWHLGKKHFMQKPTQESATSWKPRVAVIPDYLHIVRGSWGVTQGWRRDSDVGYGSELFNIGDRLPNSLWQATLAQYSGAHLSLDRTTTWYSCSREVSWAIRDSLEVLCLSIELMGHAHSAPSWSRSDLATFCLEGIL